MEGPWGQLREQRVRQDFLRSGACPSDLHPTRDDGSGGGVSNLNLEAQAVAHVERPIGMQAKRLYGQRPLQGWAGAERRGGGSAGERVRVGSCRGGGFDSELLWPGKPAHAASQSASNIPPMIAQRWIRDIVRSG